jgi:hypothetical protein
MEPSKPPKDVLGLGQYLVRELDFEDGVDTLGRWMAHHVAELIDQAEHGATAAERVKARKSATETILKIWEHRASLPGNTYPLATYKDVLKVLDRLPPDKNPFRYISLYGETKREQRAIDLFDSFSRLILALLLMELPSGEETAQTDAAAIEALSETEQHVLTALQQWGELFEPTSEDSRRAGKGKSKSGGGAKINLNKVAVELIDDLTTTLNELRSELEKTISSL